MLKISGDTREALRVTTQDLTSKLESRSAELMRQISTEHAERLRFQDHLGDQIDLKTKIMDEKLQYKADEIKESQDTIVATFQSHLRKMGEQVGGSLADISKANGALQKMMDVVVTECQKRIVQTEDSLTAKLNNFASELQQTRAILGKECEKIGDIIRDEIGARFTSDV